MNHLNPNEALEHVKGVLLASYKAVTEMGFNSRIVEDTSLDLKTLGDVSAQRALHNYFKESGLPITLYTEESEESSSFSERPEYSAVGDEIDGSYNLKHGLGMLPHGGILGIADKHDPRFKDFLASGFLEFNSGNLFYATRKNGGYVIEHWTGGNRERKELKTSENENINAKDLFVVADIYMLGDLSRPLIPYVARSGGDFKSTAIHLAMVATGNCDIFVLGDNCPNPKKRRTGEEIAPGYLIVKEAGGVGLDWNGNDLGKEKVDLYKGKTFHAVFAATEKLGHDFLDEMHKMPKIKDYMERKQL